MPGTAQKGRRKFVPEMSGAVARWYARMRGSDSQLATYRAPAAEFAADLPASADVLEVACWPGYLSVERAPLGVRVHAVDVSPAFVAITGENARRAGLEVDVWEGDVAALPFPGQRRRDALDPRRAASARLPPRGSGGTVQPQSLA